MKSKTIVFKNILFTKKKKHLSICFRTSTLEHEEEELEDDGENEEVEAPEGAQEDDDDDEPVDDGQIKPFSCTLCSVSFSKFEVYREHFVSIEHRYKRRDEKKRLGVSSLFDCCIFVQLIFDLIFRKEVLLKHHRWKYLLIYYFLIK